MLKSLFSQMSRQFYSSCLNVPPCIFCLKFKPQIEKRMKLYIIDESLELNKTFWNCSDDCVVCACSDATVSCVAGTSKTGKK